MTDSSGKDDSPSHFKGKDALNHVVEAQSKGIIAKAESHGTEMPGHWSAATDAAKETAIALMLIWILFSHIQSTAEHPVAWLAVFILGWVFWRGGRSGWLGWQRLERLHRLMEEEEYEIQHHRQQERDELRELYRAKGFHGKLLEDVLDVLMADDNRLLKVMLEEEMGLQLKALDHPIQQTVGAVFGTIVSGGAILLAASFGNFWGISLTVLSLLGISGGLAAAYEKNQVVPAVVWNVAFGALSLGSVHFLMEYVIS